jgi:hypothetical protein
VDACEKVDIIKSFRQEKDERVGDFLNQIKIGYDRFILGLAASFLVAPSNSETPAEKTRREMAVGLATEYHLASFFLVGLQDHLLRDVTKSRSTLLEEMLQVAKRSEQAHAQTAKGHRIAAAAAPVPVEPTLAEAVAAAVAAAFASRGGGGGGGKGQGQGQSGGQGGKTKTRPLSEVTCYFCLTLGHYSNNCELCKKERAQGKWRPTIKDAIMSKEAFDKVSKEEKQRGRTFQASAAAPPVGAVTDVTNERLFSSFFTEGGKN